MNEIEKGQLVVTTVQCFTRANGSLSNFPGLLKRVITERAWEKRVQNGQCIELPNLHSLVTERPIRGWGQDPAKVEAVIRDDPEVLAMWREAMTGAKHKKRAKDDSDNVTIISHTGRGNSRAYTVSRLKKQRPDLFESVSKGKMSANAAAVLAGFRKQRTPLELLRSAWRRANENEKKIFLSEITKA
jgi:hypothetical protein